MPNRQSLNRCYCLNSTVLLHHEEMQQSAARDVRCRVDVDYARYRYLGIYVGRILCRI